MDFPDPTYPTYPALPNLPSLTQLTQLAKKNTVDGSERNPKERPDMYETI